jgi:hypothetical protein
MELGMLGARARVAREGMAREVLPVGPVETPGPMVPERIAEAVVAGASRSQEEMGLALAQVVAGQGRAEEMAVMENLSSRTL